MQSHYHIYQVLISCALSFISAYNVVCFADVHRVSAVFTPRYFSPSTQLILMSLALGGGAIWSMHFTGMAALVLETDEGQQIPLRYNVATTLVSLVAAVVCVYIGLILSTQDRVYTKDKEEIFQMLTDDVSFSGIDIRNRSLLYRMAFLKGIKDICLGGVITGGGVCVMHYIGMMAQHSQESISMKWNVGIVAASVIIAVAASIAAFWILFRLLPLFPGWESLRIASSLIMAIAVCGMHYTGMEAATYQSPSKKSSEMDIGGQYLNSDDAGVVAISSSLILNWLLSMVIQSELRYASFIRAQRLEKANKELKVLYEKYPNSAPRQSHYSRSYSQGDQRDMESLAQPSVQYHLPGHSRSTYRKHSGAATISPDAWSDREAAALPSKEWKEHHMRNEDVVIESSHEDPCSP